MNESQAQNAVTISAFVVAATYAYRRLAEKSTSPANPAPPTSHFVIGFGFTYIVLSLLAQGAPALGGMLAVTVAVGDLLANGIGLTQDLTGALAATTSATTTPTDAALIAADAASVGRTVAQQGTPAGRINTPGGGSESAATSTAGLAAHGITVVP